MRHSIKNPFPATGKTASVVRNRKWKKIGLHLISKNCVHQQKKAPNKSKKFVINRISVSTSQNEGFLEKCDFTGPRSYFHSNQYLKKKKLKKTVSYSRNKFFFKYWPSCNCNNGFQKMKKERISFPLNRKSVTTGCNKGFV